MTCEQLCSYMEIFAALMQDGKEADDYESFIQVLICNCAYIITGQNVLTRRQRRQILAF